MKEYYFIKCQETKIDVGGLLLLAMHANVYYLLHNIRHSIT